MRNRRVVSARWRRQSERGSRIPTLFITWVTLHIGRWAARLLLYPITAYFLVSAREQRAASRQFLSRALGRRVGWPDVARHFHSFAATILDRVHLVVDDVERFDLRVHGLDAIIEKADQGRGCILLGAHLGSFEVMRMLASFTDKVSVKVMMYEEHNARLTRLLYSFNPKYAESIIALGGVDVALQAGESLNRGEMVGMLGDRVAGSERTTRCRFFGEKATFPAGPMLMASMLKVPVLLFFGIYLGANRYGLHFELFADEVTIRREQRDADIQEWVQRYADRLEHFARLAPYNWFNFYDFWAEG